MKMSIDISTKDLKDLLTTAIESGGIAYWAEVKSYNHKRGTCTVREHNDEEDPKKRGPWIRVTTKMLLEGLERCAAAAGDEGGWAFGEWLKDRTGDMNSADNIFQFAVLKELKYG